MKKFKYYRYLLAEKLHKAINVLLGCRCTDFALGSRLEKEDIEDCRSNAKHIGVSVDEYVSEWQEREKKDLIRILLNTLEQDGYLSWKEIADINGGEAEVSFRLSLLGVRAKTILNEENQKSKIR